MLFSSPQLPIRTKGFIASAVRKVVSPLSSDVSPLWESPQLKKRPASSEVMSCLGQPAPWLVALGVGRQLLRWPPKTFASWYSCPCVILCPWVCAGPSNLLLTNKIRQKCCLVTSEIRLQNTVASVLGTFIFLLIRSEGSQLPYCGLPYEEAHMERN